MCPLMTADWRHLANTIELVHPSAHSSRQPKRQMDRFSRFCTAHGRKCLYFTMGAPIHQNCSFSWGIWTPSNTILGPTPAQNPNCTSIGSAVFAQMTAECPYALQWFARFLLKIAPHHGGLDPMIPWAHLCPQPKRQLDRCNRFAGVVWLTGMTEIPSQRPYSTRSVTIDRMYIWSTVTRLNNAQILSTHTVTQA